MNFRSLILPVLTIVVAAGALLVLNFLGQQLPADEGPVLLADANSVPEAVIDEDEKRAEQSSVPAAEPEPEVAVLEATEDAETVPEQSDQDAVPAVGEADSGAHTETLPVAVEEDPLDLAIKISPLSALEQPRFGRTTIKNSGELSIIRGQGVPNTRLELLVNDHQAAETFVDPDGNWSLYEFNLLPAGLHVLSLRTHLADGRVGLSDETVSVLMDPASGQVEPQMAVLGDAAGVRTLLSGPRFVREAVPQIALVEGDVLRLLGKAPAGSEVRLTLAGQSPAAIPAAFIGADGVWEFRLDAASGQTATLIQWNPATQTEEVRQTLDLPTQAAIDEALTIGQQQVILF